jgi:hypothetical protein
LDANTVGARDFSLLQNHPDQFWGPPRLLFSGYQGSFMEVKQLGLEVDTQLRLVPRLRMTNSCYLQSTQLNMI